MILRMTRRGVVSGLMATPLFVTPVFAKKGKAVETVSNLTTDDGRKVQLWRWAPEGRKPRGHILFSHGNSSSPKKYGRLLGAWAAQGWDVLAPLHVDSTDHPEKDRFGPMQSWATRLEDLALVSSRWGSRPYFATGHSYGALMALVLGGAGAVPPGGQRDPRVRAVIALSPPGPMPGFVEAARLASLAVPALIQTGDRDVFPGSPPESWSQHLIAYDAAAPGGGRHALILKQVDHYFGGLYGRPELPGPKAEAQFELLLKASERFLAHHVRRGARPNVPGIELPPSPLAEWRTK